MVSTAGTPGCSWRGRRRLLDLLAENHPELSSALRSIAADPSTLEERWPGLEKIAIDHAVAEPAAAAGRVAMVPGPFPWEDLGDFARWPAARDEARGVHVLGDPPEVVAVDSTRSRGPRGRPAVAVVGLDDVVVVDTGDAVLVTSYARAQEVKAVVDELRRRDRADLT